MGNDDGGKKVATTAGTENLSLAIPANALARDFLQRFTGGASESAALGEEDEEVELNLGLSLGGRLGVDRSFTKLRRSSSIASCLPAVRDDSNDAVAPAGAGLVRTSSLPLEAEEEWRKRRQLQSLRRMEAKRRRSEKQTNLRAEKGGSVSGERLEREGHLGAVKGTGGSSMESHGGSDWVFARGKGRYVGTYGRHGFVNPASEMLAESKEGSSSGGLELEGKALQGSLSIPEDLLSCMVEFHCL